jgi:hypothetical protein
VLRAANTGTVLAGVQERPGTRTRNVMAADEVSVCCPTAAKGLEDQ